jgi:hypothetical protein
MLSLRAGIGSSSLRLIIILRTRSKEGRGLLRIMRATGAIILRLFVSARTQRITTRATSMRILLCRSAIVSFIEAGPSSG